MAKPMKLFLLTSLLLSLACALDSFPKEVAKEASQVAAPMLGYGARAPEPYLGYMPAPYPAYYPRPEYLYNYPPMPAYSSFMTPSASVERRLTDNEPVIAPKEEKDEAVATKAEQAVPIKLESASIKPAIKPRSLEVKPTAPSKQSVKKNRSLHQLSTQQRSVAKLIRPYVRFLRSHRKEPLQSLHAAFKNQFKDDNGFFESNFWPIVESNYRSSGRQRFKFNKMEGQIAQKIFKIDFHSLPKHLIKKASLPTSQPKLVLEGDLTSIFQKLSE